MHHYSSVVLTHARSPRNVGELQPCDGRGELSTNSIVVQISVRVTEGVVTEAKFRASTCVIALAACSRLTEMAVGLRLDEAAALTAEMLASELEEIPAYRMDRCELAVSVLRTALAQAGRRSSFSRFETLEATG